MKFSITLNFLMLMFVACGSGKKDDAPERKEGWTDFDIAEVKNGCFNTVVEDHPEWSWDQGREICNCMVDELSYRYSYYEVIAYPEITISNLKDHAAVCRHKAGLPLQLELELSLEFFLTEIKNKE